MHLCIHTSKQLAGQVYMYDLILKVPISKEMPALTSSSILCYPKSYPESIAANSIHAGHVFLSGL